MVNFFSDYKDFQIEEPEVYEQWISKCLDEFNLEEGEISYSFVNDEELLSLNKEIFNHDYYTDIITIDQRVGDFVSGDIFISIDRVKENASSFEKSFKNELKRVLAHGLLHIIGYKDHSEQEKSEMRKQEELCISLF